MAHAPIGPSAFGRYMACPAAYTFRHLDSSGLAAAEGTAAHHVLESLLNEREVEPGEEAPNGVTMTREMIDTVRPVANWVLDRAAPVDGYLFSELKVEVGRALGLPDPSLCWGTADVVIYDARELHVLDLKYGHQPVHPEGNPQIELYALGALCAAPETVHTVHLTILQPRVDDRPKTVTVSRADLEARGADYTAVVDQVLSEAPRAVPGDDQCRWCPGATAGACPDYLEWVAFDSFGAGDPEGMSPEEIAEVLEREARVRAFLDQVRMRAMQLLESGQQVPGWKRVASRGRRAWFTTDQEELKAELKRIGIPVRRAFQQVPLSPAQLEKHLPRQRRGILGPLIKTSQGSITLAPEDDKREAVDNLYTPV